MTKIKFDRIISYSSEHPNHKAENLLSELPSSSGTKKWRCLEAGEPRASVILQTSEPYQVQSIDIGNDGSAFVEILARRAEQAYNLSTDDDGFRTLLPAASFLTPMESRNEENISRVRMFGQEKLSKDLSSQKWDQFKVICTQPFNKRLRYGLSFISINAVGTEKKIPTTIESKDKQTSGTRLGLFTLRDEPEDTEISCRRPISLFAAKKNNEISSESKPPSVAATLRSEATLAEIACQDENAQKRKYPEKVVKPDLSLIKKTEESNKENGKKRKIDYRFNVSRSEEEQEQRRSDLKAIVDRFVADSNLNTYDLPADLNGHDRKLVHELASELSLEHESVGSGKKRHIVLKKQGSSGFPISRKNNDMLPRRDVLPGERPISPPNPIEKKKILTPSRLPSSSVNNSASNNDNSKPKSDKTFSKKQPEIKTFSKLFEGVKFVISGYQNPLRSEIRQKALDMGAKYSADWDNTCTHLVCAFVNTPKFNQVRKQSRNAKIVKSNWIEICYKDKIRYPWRRHCLDPSDKNAEESEEEIWDEKMYNMADKNDGTLTSESKNQGKIDDDPYDKDTDDEIEDVLRESTNVPNASITSVVENKVKTDDDPYDKDTDDEIDEVLRETKINEEKRSVNLKEAAMSCLLKESSSPKREIIVDSDDAYNADTDIDEDSEQNNDSSCIKPDIKQENVNIKTSNSINDRAKVEQHHDFFSNLTFLLYGVCSEDETRKMKKCILGSGGAIKKFMSPQIDYIISLNDSNDWDRNMELALKDNSNVKIAKSQFISDCYRDQELLKDKEYFIVKK